MNTARQHIERLQDEFEDHKEIVTAAIKPLQASADEYLALPKEEQEAMQFQREYPGIEQYTPYYASLNAALADGTTALLRADFLEQLAVKTGKLLKKNNIAVDVVSMGESSPEYEIVAHGERAYALGKGPQRGFRPTPRSVWGRRDRWFRSPADWSPCRVWGCPVHKAQRRAFSFVLPLE